MSDETSFKMETMSKDEAEEEVSVSRQRESKYDPVIEQAKNADLENESVVVRGIEKTAVQGLRNIAYRRFGKENVIVRASEQDDGDGYIAVLRARQEGEYLRGDDEDE